MDFSDFIYDSSSIDFETLIPAIVIGAAQASKLQNRPRNTGLPGREYLHELLNCGSPKRIYDVLRMRSTTFFRLCDWLELHTALQSTAFVSVQEQVAMFLWTINYSASSRQVMERFQHSGETVSR